MSRSPVCTDHCRIKWKGKLFQSCKHKRSCLLPRGDAHTRMHLFKVSRGVYPPASSARARSSQLCVTIVACSHGCNPAHPTKRRHHRRIHVHLTDHGDGNHGMLKVCRSFSCRSTKCHNVIWITQQLSFHDRLTACKPKLLLSLILSRKSPTNY